MATSKEDKKLVAEPATEVEATTPAKGVAVEAAETVAVAQSAAASQGSEIASAIAQGLKGATEKNFELKPDEGVDHRFSVVRNKQGEVMLRENETGTLSKIQLESIEEKEASIQGQEVEEV